MTERETRDCHERTAKAHDRTALRERRRASLAYRVGDHVGAHRHSLAADRAAERARRYRALAQEVMQ